MRCDKLAGCLDAILAAVDEFRAGPEPLDDVAVPALQMPCLWPGDRPHQFYAARAGL